MGSLVWLQNFKEPEGQLARWLVSAGTNSQADVGSTSEFISKATQEHLSTITQPSNTLCSADELFASTREDQVDQDDADVLAP